MRERVDKLLWDRMGIGTRGLWVGTFHAICGAHPAPVGRGGRPAQGLRHLRRRRSEAAARAGADRSQGAGADVPGASGAVGDRSRQEPGASSRGRLRVERLLRRRRRQGLPPVRGAAGGGERDRLRRPAAVGAEAVRQRDAGGRGDWRSASTTCWSTSSRTPTASSTGWCACCRARTNNLTVVGDDDQSIYRWRGADIRNILDFERDLPGARVVKLEQNYRSTGNILARRQRDHREEQRAAAEAAVDRGGGGRPDRPVRGRDRARRGRVRRQPHREALSATLAPRDFAVFYRTNAQSRVLEDALRARNLPYTVVGGTRFFERAEIKDLLAYLRAVANPDDGIALQRIINVPARGIGAATVDRIGDIIYERKIPAWQALELVRRGRGAARVGAAQEGRGVRRADDAAARRGRGAGARVAGREDPRGERLPRRAGERRDDGVGGADREPAGARGADARVRARGGGADAARLPGADRAGVRRRRLRPGQGRRSR